MPPSPPPTFNGAMKPPPAPAFNADPKPSMAPPPPPTFHAPSSSSAAAASAPPPPPAFDAPAPILDEAADRKRSLIAVAAQAASRVAPGQMDRALSDALRQAKTETDGIPATGGGGDGDAGAARPPGTYEAPGWAGLPRQGLEFSLDVLKTGQFVETVALAGKDCFTFGRSPAADVITEHPSCSRLHCVLQFRGESSDVYLYDCGSTHGTFVNKRRLKGHAFCPLRVGDQIRLGQSSRMYVLNGPADLMPEERLSQKKLEEILAKQRGDRAEESEGGGGGSGFVPRGVIPVRHEVSWGMADDPEEGAGPTQGPGAEAASDWRALVSRGHKLTDKQEKLREKISGKELKITRNEEELGRLRAKERQGELSETQSKQMAHLEIVLDKLREELDDLEETLIDSLEASLGAKANAAEAAGPKAKRRRAAEPDDDDDDAGDTDDDEFYDLTATRKKRRGLGPVPGAAGHPEAKEHVETLESLCGRQEALRAELRGLQEDLLREEAYVDLPGPAGAREGVDELDAFMGSVKADLERSKVEVIQREIADVEAQLRKVDRLVARVDPTGAFRPSAEDLEASKLREERKRQLERARREAEAKRAREQQTKEARETAAAARHAGPEREEDEGPVVVDAETGLEMGARRGAEEAEDGGAARAATAPENPPPVAQPRPAPPVEETGGLIVRQRPAGPASTAPRAPSVGHLPPTVAAVSEEEKAQRAVEDMLAALRRGKQGAAGAAGHHGDL